MQSADQLPYNTQVVSHYIAPLFSLSLSFGPKAVNTQPTYLNIFKPLAYTKLVYISYTTNKLWPYLQITDVMKEPPFLTQTTLPLVKNSRTRKSITVLTRPNHLSKFWARWIQSTLNYEYRYYINLESWNIRTQPKALLIRLFFIIFLRFSLLLPDPASKNKRERKNSGK